MQKEITQPLVEGLLMQKEITQPLVEGLLMQKEITQPLVETILMQKDIAPKHALRISMSRVNIILKILLIPMRILSVMVILTMPSPMPIPLTGQEMLGLLEMYILVLLVAPTRMKAQRSWRPKNMLMGELLKTASLLSPPLQIALRNSKSL